MRPGANLEERRAFDDAAADYERIYQLAFKDPKWMRRLKFARAREELTMGSTRSESP
jgi:hypothetical protein